MRSSLAGAAALVRLAALASLALISAAGASLAGDRCAETAQAVQALHEDDQYQATTLLFAAARVDHLDTTILPALARGAWVVSDRFADSTRAYQGAAGNLPPEFIISLERLTVGPNRPDLTLILDLPPEIGLKRAAERRQRGPADRFESEKLPFHQILRQAFLDIAAAIWSAVESRLDPAGALKANPA